MMSIKTKAQIIFKEDFGRHDGRKTSPYIPQGGVDSSLPKFSHGSAFYKFGEYFANASGENLNSSNINDGYYAILSPHKSLNPKIGSWWNTNVYDNTTKSSIGAALILNAGATKNQYYRRGVVLEHGKTYKLSAYILNIASGTGAHKFKMQAQNIITESNVGESPVITATGTGVWVQYSWTFKVPTNTTCNSNIAVSFRNQAEVTQGNDVYIDDIQLEETVDASAVELTCEGTVNLDNIIKPENDTYKWTTGSYFIGQNDKVSVNNAMVTVVLSGATKNASISTLGVWPTGITLDPATGEVKIATGAVMPTAPLKYQVCNLIGACSEATVTFIKLEENISLTGEVSEQCNYDGKINTYTLTIKNNSNIPFVASAAETLEILFTINHSTGLNYLDDPDPVLTTAVHQNIWNYTRGGLRVANPLSHSFKLVNGTQIPANGSVQLTFKKDWNLFLLTEEFRRSLDIKLSVKDSGGANIDKDTSDNSLFISVFKSSLADNVPNLDVKVSQFQIITVGEAAGLGANTDGYTFYKIEGGVEVEIPSNYLIPTQDKGINFQFTYKSECKLFKATVSVPVGISNTGSITTSQGVAQNTTNACYGSDFVVYGLTAASTTPVTPITYSWEVSKDNGATWLSVSSVDENYMINGEISLTLKNLLETTKVRRVVKVTSDNITAVSNDVTVNVIHNQLTLSNTNFSIQSGSTITLPTAITTEPSVVVYKDHLGNVISGNTITYNAVGLYTITVTVTRNATPNCVTTETILINVYDLSSCNETREKVMVTQEGWGSVPVLFISGIVSYRPNAIDNDLSTHSTITIPIGLLGLGTTWQNLRFDHTISKGTPVTVKVGQEYSAVQVGGGVTIQALDAAGKTIGPLLAAGDGALLDLLVGDNVFEYSFIPKNSSGAAVDYSGVRIVVGSTVAVANSAKVFGAFYEKKKTIDVNNPTCNTIGNVVSGASKPSDYVGNVTLNPLVDDVLWGVEDIGLGVASSLASIVHPYLAVDKDLESFAIFNKSVAALNRQKLTVKFNQVARPGDQVRIIMGGFEVPVLDLSLLTDIKVQRYLGNLKVGPQINGSQFKVLDLNLLALLGSTGNRKALIVDAINEPFDRVELTYLSTVQVGLLGDYTYIYDISIKPKLIFDGGNGIIDSTNSGSGSGSSSATNLCAGDFLRIEKPDPCTSYQVSFANATKDGDGNITSFTDISNSSLALVRETGNMAFYEFNSLHATHKDNLYIKIQTYRQGCPYAEPIYLPVNLLNCKDAIVNPVLKLSTK